MSRPIRVYPKSRPNSRSCSYSSNSRQKSQDTVRHQNMRSDQIAPNTRGKTRYPKSRPNSRSLSNTSTSSNIHQKSRDTEYHPITRSEPITSNIQRNKCVPKSRPNSRSYSNTSNNLEKSHDPKSPRFTRSDPIASNTHRKSHRRHQTSGDEQKGREEPRSCDTLQKGREEPRSCDTLQKGREEPRPCDTFHTTVDCPLGSKSSQESVCSYLDTNESRYSVVEGLRSAGRRFTLKPTFFSQKPKQGVKKPANDDVSKRRHSRKSSRADSLAGFTKVHSLNTLKFRPKREPTRTRPVRTWIKKDVHLPERKYLSPLTVGISPPITTERREHLFSMNLTQSLRFRLGMDDEPPPNPDARPVTFEELMSLPQLNQDTPRTKLIQESGIQESKQLKKVQHDPTVKSLKSGIIYPAKYGSSPPFTSPAYDRGGAKQAVGVVKILQREPVPAKPSKGVSGKQENQLPTWVSPLYRTYGIGGMYGQNGPFFDEVCDEDEKAKPPTPPPPPPLTFFEKFLKWAHLSKTPPAKPRPALPVRRRREHRPRRESPPIKTVTPWTRHGQLSGTVHVKRNEVTDTLWF